MKPKSWHRSVDETYIHDDYPDIFIGKVRAGDYYSTFDMPCFVVFAKKNSNLITRFDRMARKNIGWNVIGVFVLLRYAKEYVRRYYHTFPRKTE